MSKTPWILAVVGISLLCTSGALAENATPGTRIAPATVSDLYPEMAFGVLSYAQPAALPDGLLAKAGELTFSRSDLEGFLATEPPATRGQLEKNSFLAADYALSRRLILYLAKEDAARSGGESPQETDEQLLNRFLGKLVAPVTVSDPEVAEFYGDNREMFGGAPLKQVKDQIAEYLLADKRQAAINEYLQTLGMRMTIEVSAPWAKEQSDLARDNPLDKARSSGLPTVADFSSESCPPCRMLEPIIQRLQKKYDGQVNVVCIPVEENPLLAMRYGAEATPTLVFFDKDGKGVGRHVGYLSQKDLERKMSEVGIR